MALSYSLRAGVAVGYVGLLGVNTIFGAGLFGMPTNAVISAAYPTLVTPAGFTFAIWGPIFLLQGGGAALLASGAGLVPRAAGAAVAPCWLAAWAFEVAWQLVFCLAPRPAARASPADRLSVLVPAAVCLLGAQAAMLAGAARLRQALLLDDSETAASHAAVALFLALPTGLNAAWLAAASGIGLSLVAQLLPPLTPTPRGAAGLLSLVISGGAVAAPALAARGGGLGAFALAAGYALATAWACFGMTKGDAPPPAVKAVAAVGVKVAAASGAMALATILRAPIGKFA